MGQQDRFDKYIRQKLEEREIPPREEAWDKLEKRLESGPGTPPAVKKVFYWVAAASVVVLFSVGIYFLRDTDKDNSYRVTDVDTHKEPVEKENKQEEVQETPGGANVVSVKPPDSAIKAVKEIQSLPEVSRTNERPLRETPEKEIRKEEPIVPVTPKEEVASLEDEKVKEVVDRIMKIQETRTVTDEEIETLLGKAQKEIDSQRLLIKQTDNVDAMALLLEVEDELDRTFREKVFDALKEGFKKVQTAVANRKP